MANRRTLRQAYQEPTAPDLASFVFGTSSISSSPLSSSEIGTEVMVPISKIHKTFSFTPNSSPVRYYYDLEELKHWAETDLKPNGIRTALWVRPMPGISGEYELVAGLRRLTGAELAQILEVPVKVFEWTDEQAYAAAFDENDRRRDFSELEETDCTLNLLGTMLGQEQSEVISLLYRMDNAAKGKVTQDVLGSPQAQSIEQFFIGRARLSWKSFVASRLPLLRQPPEILEVIREGKIQYTKALAIAKLKDPEARNELLERAIAQAWSLTQIQEQIAELVTADPISEPSRPRPLKQRFSATIKQLSLTKAWADPDKAKQLEKLLKQLDKLAGAEGNINF